MNNLSLYTLLAAAIFVLGLAGALQSNLLSLGVDQLQMPAQLEHQGHAAPEAKAVEEELPNLLGDDPDYLGQVVNPESPAVLYLGRREGGKRSGVRHRFRAAAGGKSFSLRDPEGFLRGTQKAGEMDKEQLLNIGGWQGPAIVAIGSNECLPCVKEVGDVVRDLSGPLSEHNVTTVFVLMRLDGFGFKSFKLARERDRLFDAYNEDHRRVSESKVSPKQWMIFAQDQKDHWMKFATRVLRLFDEKRTFSLPVTLLMDACGHIHQAIQGRLTRRRISHLKTSAMLLADSGCEP